MRRTDRPEGVVPPEMRHPGNGAPNFDWMTWLLSITTAKVVTSAMAVVISAVFHAG